MGRPADPLYPHETPRERSERLTRTPPAPRQTAAAGVPRQTAGVHVEVFAAIPPAKKKAKKARSRR